MNVVSKNWQKKLMVFFIAVSIYFLLLFLYAYSHIAYVPDECASYLVGSFGASGRIPCSIEYAGRFMFTPFFLFDEENAGNLLEGVGVAIWLIATVIYTVLFIGIYTFVLY